MAHIFPLPAHTNSYYVKQTAIVKTVVSFLFDSDWNLARCLGPNVKLSITRQRLKLPVAFFGFALASNVADFLENAHFGEKLVALITTLPKKDHKGGTENPWIRPPPS